MRIIGSTAGMQRLALAWRRSGIKVGFVPTMGYLHAGHASLIKRARRAVGSSGRVVVSIYVNPTQFGPKEDFTKYPRDLERDKRLCREAGADVAFVPSDQEMYPGSKSDPFSTYVTEEQLSRKWRVPFASSHFRGVTTVVAKLLNIVLPSSRFGAKDFQQAAIIQKMVRDPIFQQRLSSRCNCART
jgi:pantoate--beta-alanine ligase